MPIVKICGLSEAATLDAALDAGADMVGFVFFEASPRHVTLDRAPALVAQVAGRARKVALTVDADDAALAAVIAALAPDMLQLHGSESPERVSYVRARFGLPVIRAISLAAPDDVKQIAVFDNVADQLLFDAKAPKDASRPGGNGEAFDWSILRGIVTKRPWLLAGGLHGGNVARAVKETAALGVDVSSGVEIRPGVKDAKKIACFVALARQSFTVPSDGHLGERLGSVGSIG